MEIIVSNEKTIDDVVACFQGPVQMMALRIHGKFVGAVKFVTAPLVRFVEELNGSWYFREKLNELV